MCVFVGGFVKNFVELVEEYCVMVFIDCVEGSVE